MTVKLFRIVINNTPFPLHLAVTGGECNHTFALRKSDWSELESLLLEHECPYYPLPTPCAFHSPMIEPTRDAYIERARQLNKQAPQIPIASCITGEIVDSVTSEYLWNIVREPVKLDSTLRKHLNPNEVLCIDMSPQRSHIALIGELFGRNSKVFRKSHKTMTPFQTGVKNMRKLTTC